MFSGYMKTKSPWQNFEALKLHYYYNALQKDIIKNLRQKKKVDLEKYKVKTKDYPRAIVERDLKKLGYHNRSFLKNSYELWEEAQKVSDSVRPILFYYSWQQFAAFFIYTLFKWPGPSRRHGVVCHFGEKNPDNIEEIRIEFSEKGFFRRLIDTFVILGRPTAYGPWLSLESKQGLVFKANRIDSRIPSDNMKMINVLDFEPRKFAKDFKTMYPNSFYGFHVDYLLTDFLVVFIASNFARYRPQLWRDILDGKGENEARFNLRVEKAYNNYVFGVNCFLNVVWQEFLRWKS